MPPKRPSAGEEEGNVSPAIVGILGAGPIGCLLGVCLACVSTDVTVVDWWADSNLVSAIKKLGIRTITSLPSGSGDSERRLGPGDGSRRFTNDVRDLKSASVLLVDVPRAYLREVAAILQAHAAVGCDVVLLQSGTGAAQELVSYGLVKGKWRGGSISEASVHLRARLTVGSESGKGKGGGTPPTVLWYTPSSCSQICLDGRPATISVAKRVAQLLKSAGLPTVVEDRLDEVQLNDVVFHGLADVLSICTGAATLANAFKLVAWRQAMAAVVEEALKVLKAAGVPARSVSGISQMAQRNYVSILRAPACIFSLLQSHFIGELLPGCNDTPLSEALRAVQELEQLGKRHTVNTPRLSLLTERLAPLLENCDDGRLDDKGATELLKDLVARPRPIVKKLSETATSQPANGANPSSTDLASTLVVTKEHRRKVLELQSQRPENSAVPVHAAELFGVDPAELTATKLGRSEQASTKRSSGSAKAPPTDVSSALQRYEQSKKKGSS